jgi:hypothetical protein
LARIDDLNRWLFATQQNDTYGQAQGALRAHNGGLIEAIIFVIDCSDFSVQFR